MKCPYRDFKDCLIEKCPSCTYETVEHQEIAGRAPYDNYELGLSRGTCWWETKKEYIFKSCKLVENNVQPVPQTVINNETTVKPQTNVAVMKRGGYFRRTQNEI